MAKMNSTTRLNRTMFDAITLGFADGLAVMAQNILDASAPFVPDAPPYGVGLVDTGGFGVWAHGKKVDGDARKPKGQIGAKEKGQVVMVVGYGWPGHYAEHGTIKEPARPFLTPGALAVVPDSEGIFAAAMAPRLRAVR